MSYRTMSLTNEQIAGIDTTRTLAGYPSFADRLRMDSKTLPAMGGGIVIPDEGLWHVHSHDNRTNAPAGLRHLVQPLEPDDVSVAYWKRLGLELDQKRRPIHPFGRQLLTTVGVVTGPGFYWKYGPNGTMNLVASREHAGIKQHAIIRRNDKNRRWALPGGFVEIGEMSEDAALREFGEELGLQLKGLGTTAMVGDVIIGTGNTRDTLHAWTEDGAAKFEPDDQAHLFDVPLVPNPKEVLDFSWATLDEIRQKVAEGIFPLSHMKFIELSMQPSR